MGRMRSLSSRRRSNQLALWPPWIVLASLMREFPAFEGQYCSLRAGGSDRSASPGNGTSTRPVLSAAPGRRHVVADGFRFLGHQRR